MFEELNKSVHTFKELSYMEFKLPGESRGKKFSYSKTLGYRFKDTLPLTTKKNLSRLQLLQESYLGSSIGGDICYSNIEAILCDVDAILSTLSDYISVHLAKFGYRLDGRKVTLEMNCTKRTIYVPELNGIVLDADFTTLPGTGQHLRDLALGVNTWCRLNSYTPVVKEFNSDDD